MPSQRHIEFNYESCFPCKFFKTQLVVSGRNPIYETRCTHGSVLLDEASYFRSMGRLISDGRNGPDGRDRRPDWCPIRGDAQAEKEAMGEDE